MSETNKYGLDLQIIESILSVFKKYPAVEKVILYGSRAKGNFNPGSDIDICLKGQALDLSILNHISYELDDLYLPYTFDLSIYHHIDHQDLLDHIQRVGICLYTKP